MNYSCRALLFPPSWLPLYNGMKDPGLGHSAGDLQCMVFPRSTIPSVWSSRMDSQHPPSFAILSTLFLAQSWTRGLFFYLCEFLNSQCQLYCCFSTLSPQFPYWLQLIPGHSGECACMRRAAALSIFSIPEFLAFRRVCVAKQVLIKICEGDNQLCHSTGQLQDAPGIPVWPMSLSSDWMWKILS